MGSSLPQLGDTKTFSRLRTIFKAVGIPSGAILALESVPFAEDIFEKTLPPHFFTIFWALFSISFVGYIIILRIIQKRKNAWVQNNASRILATGGLDVPIFLFLRSFNIEDASDPFAQIEQELSELLTNHGIFLAIGDKERTYGAAKLMESDQTWQSTAQRLMKDAKAIFFMPGPTQSALWEMDQILNSDELRKKTSWIMTRGSQGFFQWIARSVEKKRWEDVMTYFRKNGATIPAYQSSGGAFVLDNRCHSEPLVPIDEFMRFLNVALNKNDSVSHAGATSLDSLTARIWRIAAEENDSKPN